MKLDISSVKAAETKDLDVSQFFNVEEKVIITIRRMTTKQRNEITSMMLEGQKVNPDSEEVEMSNSDWFVKVRIKELLYTIVQNKNFPFEKWDKQFIDEIDERNPDFIQFLQGEVQLFNRPLAPRKFKK